MWIKTNCGYFNSDYLKTANCLYLGTNNWTIEFWDNENNSYFYNEHYNHKEEAQQGLEQLMLIINRHGGI